LNERAAENWVWKYQAAVTHKSAGMRMLIRATQRRDQGVGKGMSST
jgi:hypothetical protein